MPAPASVVTGVAFIDANRNGVREARETVLPGITVFLRGTTTNGLIVNTPVTTDAQGTFRFTRLHAGNYRVVASNANYQGNTIASTTIVPLAPLADNSSVAVSVQFRGLSPSAVSLRRFLASTTGGGAAAISPPGFGLNTTNFGPFVQTPIAQVVVNTSVTTRTIDLANHFNDPDFISSKVRLVTNQGNVDLHLLDRLAPLTVANFLGYVTRNDYDNVIFHRLGSFLHGAGQPRDVLQGGQFKFSSTGGQGNLTRITNAQTPTVLDEVNLPNTAMTVAMAKTGSPNSATSEFFFNLVDNTDALSAPPQTNGGFTVFAQVDAASQAVVTNLAATNVQNKSSFDGALTDLPLRDGAGANFPTDTVTTDYAIMQDVQVLQRNDEGLTFQVLANSRPQLVNASIANHRLTLNFITGQIGTATITVRATDRFGGSVVTTFNVSRTTA